MSSPLPSFHDDGSTPQSGAIFVFGSNLAGRHGAGAAKAAKLHFGAIYGRGEGPMGSSYAIPTKGMQLEVLPLDVIEQHVSRFIDYAKVQPGLNFFVTRIGCGLAGYDDSEIAPMFAAAPSNCSFARSWKPFIVGARTAELPHTEELL